jgi:hypothetical protein
MITLVQEVEGLVKRALEIKKMPMLMRAHKAEQLILDTLGVLGNVAAEVDRLIRETHNHGQ